jgi:chaperone BCS1
VFELGYLTPETCAKMFLCFFPHPELAAIVAQKLGSYRVAPAAWQNYLQAQDDADLAVVNCDFSELQGEITKLQ